MAALKESLESSSAGWSPSNSTVSPISAPSNASFIDSMIKPEPISKVNPSAVRLSSASPLMEPERSIVTKSPSMAALLTSVLSAACWRIRSMLSLISSSVTSIDGISICKFSYPSMIICGRTSTVASSETGPASCPSIISTSGWAITSSSCSLTAWK